MLRKIWNLSAVLLLASCFLLVACDRGNSDILEKPRTSDDGRPQGDSVRGNQNAEAIVLSASPKNSIQIKAVTVQRTTVFEIQLGGGSNQPPSKTWITGKASTVVGGKTYTGYYRISTHPESQLQMTLKSSGSKSSVDKDEYTFVRGHDVLKFEFAPTSTFSDPWLTTQIINVFASQQVPGDDNGDDHPPVLLHGKVGTPTGGSLATEFGSGDSLLTVNVGGNQRLADLEAEDTHSGMKLDQGSRYTPGGQSGARKAGGKK